MLIELAAGETVIHQDSANHLRGFEGVGGVLYLTSQRLIFESHFFNIQVGNEFIPLNTIVEANKTWSKLLGIPLLENCLEVKLNDGQQHKFIVYHIDKWIAAIQSQLDSRELRESPE